MRFAYADPPYLGSAVRFYGEQAAEYDTVAGHAQLIDRLGAEFPDGWALSMSPKSLRDLLPLCPPEARVMAWVKTYARYLPHVDPAWAWDAVVVNGGRKRGNDRLTIRDWVSAPAIRGSKFVGQKPPQFCWWMFEVLGMVPDDELVDLFPGSGAVTEAWEAWKRQTTLGLSA